jgi:hypothetical protein
MPDSYYYVERYIKELAEAEKSCKGIAAKNLPA